MQLTVAYDFLPKQRSLNTSFVMDHFGIDFEQGRHVIAKDLELDLRPGDVVLFTGPSGSGKSSLLRESVRALEGESVRALESEGVTKLEDTRTPSHAPTLSRSNAPTLSRSNVLWIDRLNLPDEPLVDAMPLPVKESLELLSACRLSEAQLLLRTPAELSDGQRYRFRLALGVATLCSLSVATHDEQRTTNNEPKWLVADEFSAALDRTLAKVLAFNVRRLARRTGTGFLLATTHEDIIDDLQPDVLVCCDLDGQVSVVRGPLSVAKQEQRTTDNGRRTISFFREFWLSEGARADWPYFARWHYRSHHLCMVRRVTLLWHRDRAVGICVFAAPAAALKLRNQFFGLSVANNQQRTTNDEPRTRRSLQLKKLNRELWLLSRVVLHPTYRGAGIAAAFVRRSCETCPAPWIETLTAMGHINPFFERAGFIRVGVCRSSGKGLTAATHARIYGRRGRLSAETTRKSRYAEPVYYVFDNRKSRSPAGRG